VHQNSCLDFPTAVVISLSRCDFPAVISAQKISADTVHPESSVKRDPWQCYGDLKLGNLPFDWGTHRLATTEIDLPTPYSQLPICVEVIWISNYKETKKAASVSSYRVLVSYKLLHFLVPTYNYARGFEFNSLADFFQIMK
jgi:hypothetical protein